LARFSLGFMYDNGEGVPQDDAETVRWFRLAADQGHARAQVNLGHMYETGEGVPQNYVEAARWYRRAADQGHADAQNLLGYMYRDGGEGVPADYVQAHMWFNLAASRVTGEARENAVKGRDLAAGGLTPDDLSAAQRLAREWDAAHPREP
jgi:TPR repeat protein